MGGCQNDGPSPVGSIATYYGNYSNQDHGGLESPARLGEVICVNGVEVLWRPYSVIVTIRDNSDGIRVLFFPVTPLFSVGG